MSYESHYLETRFGGWWCGVKFGEPPDVRNCRDVNPMRFCEAIAASRTGTILLTPQLLDCPGGKRCLGWKNEEETFAQALAEKAGLDQAAAHRVLRGVPRLKCGLEKVTIGTPENPDVFLSFSQPEATMKLIREWQRSHGRPLSIETSGFMSVCGMVAVKAYLTDKICISFGCPDAREYGSIGRDRLVVGLPARVARRLARGASNAVRKDASTAPFSEAVGTTFGKSGS
jgi:uncharacterized protein (DUF169 family)